MSVPVIDLFAGPGGLGEGFSKSTAARFDVAISIEKDPMAYETLLLRAAHRFVRRSQHSGRGDWLRWDSILKQAPWEEAFDRIERSGNPLFAQACAAARGEAWNLELGPDSQEDVSRGIRKRLAPFMRRGRLPDNSVLIGGPPCQAYSVVGRSRNRGKADYVAENDHRHFLYREYLQVIREFRPAVFVMENVKGILTSRVADRHIFHAIVDDLQRPDLACGTDTGLRYRLLSLSEDATLFDKIDPQSFIIRAEEHGIPQARHRVIICGVREDVLDRAGGIESLRRARAPSVGEVIGDLPRLRPQVSFRGGGMGWQDCLQLPLADKALSELAGSGPVGERIAKRMHAARSMILRRRDPGHGADRSPVGAERPAALASWYRDRPMHLLANHESRSHMPEDLLRYLFVSSYGVEMRQSPKLTDFPVVLLPNHRNVDPDDAASAIFKDRFRVQLADYHAMTVTSHIGKDGHAFIHPDPSQCRSLTVREAARLQTFPDSYTFLGNRTSQYTQVGNAVPPLLARQIADVVGRLLNRASLADAEAVEHAEAQSVRKALSAATAIAS